VAIISKFLGCLRDGFMHQTLGSGSWAEAIKLAFFVSHGTGWPCTMVGRLGTVICTRQARHTQVHADSAQMQ